jgi:drug/metabolite transporter (DMT)-like permease
MSQNRTLTAIFLMLASMFCFSSMSASIRAISGGLHSTQIVCMRNFMSLIIIIAWAAWLKKGVPSFKTGRFKGHFWRASIGFCAMSLWFYALSIMPLTLATALSFTTPIFSTIFAILFLSERAGWRRWGAIAAGFFGIVVMLRPDQYGLQMSAFIVLASSALMGLASIFVKTLTKTESPETIVFYMALVMLFWSAPVALPYWQEVDARQLFLVFLVAFFSTAAHLMMARAYMRADMVVLMPFDFTRLIFTAILAWFFFGERLTTDTLHGALIIVASTVYIAHREAKKRKNDRIAAPSEV